MGGAGDSEEAGADQLLFHAASLAGSTLATYNRAGAAGVIDIEIGNRSIDGDSFATQ